MRLIRLWCWLKTRHRRRWVVERDGWWVAICNTCEKPMEQLGKVDEHQVWGPK
ncbi:MAG: hypothetical protein GTO41_04855 [Burkholderiales bacterium]|nr:hypothetical protein [Burkholderiales bacterium]